MRDNKCNVLERFYLELENINGIKFTPREIDIMACILAGRGRKTTGALLSIAEKTVETHIRSILHKLSCNSQEGIRDRLEKCHKFGKIKRHYLNLLTEDAFKKKLEEISAVMGHENSICSFISWQGKTPISIVSFLEKHLTALGIKISFHEREKYKSISNLIEHIEKDQANYVVYVGTQNSKVLHEKSVPSSEDTVTRDILQIPQKITIPVIFLLENKERFFPISLEQNDANFIFDNEEENYYFMFFKVLKKLLPSLDIDEIILDFKKKYEIIHDLSNMSFSHALGSQEEPQEKHISENANLKFLKKKNAQWIIGGILTLLTFSMGILVFISTTTNKENEIQTSTLRSDLIIPTEAVFLQRPELISQIDTVFNEQGGIQTVALTGLGGAGKTTIARQYARSQNSPLIWAINAETYQSLKASFETLAQELAKTESDRKRLLLIQAIRNSPTREEKMIQFVKKHLKSSKNWFLIFDNVEKFTDIQKYFPQDFNNWGQGKVILTTRNSNIQNNNCINNVIHVGELNPDQKLTLFAKIVNNGNRNPLTPHRIKEIKEFLEKLPPFPLDVSIAAYYIKATNVSYEKYLQLLEEYENEFANLQEDILKEAGNYTRSRFNIIALSLKKLIETHKDFAGLLLFMSLLSSQDIPKQLLGEYKNDVLVDDLIYNLKKYSLITDESSSTPLGSTLSMHQSIQPIIISYLIKKIELNERNKELQHISDTLRRHLVNLTEVEDLLKMKLLLLHLNNFLSHDNLLTPSMRGIINIELGCIYFNLYHYIKARKFLEQGIANLNTSGDAKNDRFAWALVHLGGVYRELGDYEKAKNSLEQSLLIYKKNFPNNYVGLASALTQLGIIYRKLGNYEKAKGLLEQGLAIFNQGLPKNQVGAARAKANLAYVYQNLGDNKKAKDLFEQSLTIFNDYKNPVAMAWILSHLGSIHKQLGNFKKSVGLLNKSIKIFATYLSENHNEATWVLAHIGDVYKELGDYKEAKKTFEKTLSIYEKNYGKKHIKTGWILKNLGQVYFQEGNIEAARNFMNQALGVFQQNKHPDVYMVLEDLAEINLKQSLLMETKGAKQSSQE